MVHEVNVDIVLEIAPEAVSEGHSQHTTGAAILLVHTGGQVHHVAHVFSDLAAPLDPAVEGVRNFTWCWSFVGWREKEGDADSVAAVERQPEALEQAARFCSSPLKKLSPAAHACACSNPKRPANLQGSGSVASMHDRGESEDWETH